MDLYSGLPYWIVRNLLYGYENPLKENVTTRVAIIGSGITGSLVANELCRAGIECCLVDKRTPSMGSSIASTALLQYEIDMPLCKLRKINGEDAAVEAFRSCCQSITDLENIFREIGLDPSFKRVPSVYLASNHKGLELIEKEYVVRKKHDLPVEFLDSQQLFDLYGIRKKGALYNESSAQIDPYRAATGLIDHNIRNRGLRFFTHTEITKWKRRSDGYTLTTDSGHKITCDYVVIAAGFEAGPFLPKKLMKLTTTFAVISKPVEDKYIWHGSSLVWETRDPYLYIRTDGANRIIAGGEDENYNDPQKRRDAMKKKSKTIRRKFRRLFPDIPFEIDMQWSGTFSSTRDGLPIIGASQDDDRMLFALGYGGNGITFSVIAAQILKNKLQGMEDSREKVFGFGRNKYMKS